MFRKVEDVVKVRGNKKKNVMKSNTDVVNDGISWLSDIDRKMLGIGATNATTAARRPIQHAVKAERN